MEELLVVLEATLTFSEAKCSIQLQDNQCKWSFCIGMTMYLSCGEPKFGHMRTASYLHSQFEICFSVILLEDSSSEMWQLLALWACPCPPEALQEQYFYLAEHLLGCLHLFTGITPKIPVLLPETGNFAPRNIVSVPEQGECPEMNIQ